MRVLYLDQYPQLVKSLFGPDDEVHVEMQFFGIDRNEVYNSKGNPLVLDYVKEWGSTYDLIVIGNNLGAGIAKAQALERSARNRVVICWHDEPSEHNIAPYRALGYRHFTTRERLVEYILEDPELYAESA